MTVLEIVTENQRELYAVSFFSRFLLLSLRFFSDFLRLSLLLSFALSLDFFFALRAVAFSSSIVFSPSRKPLLWSRKLSICVAERWAISFGTIWGWAGSISERNDES